MYPQMKQDLKDAVSCTLWIGGWLMFVKLLIETAHYVKGI